MGHRFMRAVERLDLSRPVLIGSFIANVAGESYRCGSCGAVLLNGVSTHFADQVVVVCTACGSTMESYRRSREKQVAALKKTSIH